MKKRTLALILAVLTLTAALAGCGSSYTSSAASGRTAAAQSSYHGPQASGAYLQAAGVYDDAPMAMAEEAYVDDYDSDGYWADGAAEEAYMPVPAPVTVTLSAEVPAEPVQNPQKLIYTADLNMETLDVAGELEDAIFTYGQLLSQEGVTVEYTPPNKDIPFVLGDAERLKQVFLNIMDNAAKYGRSAGRIVVTIGSAAGWVIVRFRDYGPGIPENEIPFVKKKFYKGSGKERGSGIGLSVCDEIITRHKGKLELENASDGRTGLIVTILLPVMNEEELTI